MALPAIWWESIRVSNRTRFGKSIASIIEITSNGSVSVCEQGREFAVGDAQPASVSVFILLFFAISVSASCATETLAHSTQLNNNNEMR